LDFKINPSDSLDPAGKGGKKGKGDSLGGKDSGKSGKDSGKDAAKAGKDSGKKGKEHGKDYSDSNTTNNTTTNEKSQKLSSKNPTEKMIIPKEKESYPHQPVTHQPVTQPITHEAVREMLKRSRIIGSRNRTMSGNLSNGSRISLNGWGEMEIVSGEDGLKSGVWGNLSIV
jgi:hypothetical protein